MNRADWLLIGVAAVYSAAALWALCAAVAYLAGRTRRALRRRADRRFWSRLRRRAYLGQLDAARVLRGRR